MDLSGRTKLTWSLPRTLLCASEFGWRSFSQSLHDTLFYLALTCQYKYLSLGYHPDVWHAYRMSCLRVRWQVLKEESSKTMQFLHKWRKVFPCSQIATWCQLLSHQQYQTVYEWGLTDWLRKKWKMRSIIIWSPFLISSLIIIWSSGTAFSLKAPSQADHSLLGGRAAYKLWSPCELAASAVFSVGAATLRI